MAQADVPIDPCVGQPVLRRVIKLCVITTCIKAHSTNDLLVSVLFVTFWHKEKDWPMAFVADMIVMLVCVDC
jgi:hypothetical protein